MYRRSTSPKEYRIPNHYSGVAFGKNERSNSEKAFAPKPSSLPLSEKEYAFTADSSKIRQSHTKNSHEGSEEQSILQANEDIATNVQITESEEALAKKKHDNLSNDDLLIASLLLLLMGNRDGEDGDTMLILLLFILLFSDRGA